MLCKDNVSRNLFLGGESSPLVSGLNLIVTVYKLSSLDMRAGDSVIRFVCNYTGCKLVNTFCSFYETSLGTQVFSKTL